MSVKNISLREATELLPGRPGRSTIRRWKRPNGRGEISQPALADRLNDSPRGLLVAADELSGLFGGMGQYKNGRGNDSAHWLELFHGRQLIVDRKTGGKAPIYIPRAAASVCGGIQPGILGRLLSKDHFDSGMAARFLFAFPPRREKQWSDAAVPADCATAFKSMFDRLYAMQPNRVALHGTEGGTATEPIAVRLTIGGKSEWIRFYDYHAKQQAAAAGKMAAALSKLEAYAARLALVTHCIRQAAGELSDDAGVDEHSIAAGVKFVEWFGREARRVYAMLGRSEIASVADASKLLAWIAKMGGTVTVRQTQQFGPRPYRDAPRDSLEKLAGDGFGTLVETSLRWRRPASNPASIAR